MYTLKEFFKTVLKLFLGRGVRKSYSQFGEDALIQWLLEKNTKKTYVDVGAYHPVLYSNTYALYRDGWSGLVIDPNKELSPLYRLLRPRDVFVSAAIGSGGAGVYYSFSDGAYNTLDTEVAEKRIALPWLQLKKKIEVPLKPLSQLLFENSITEIGLLTVDVEGRDLEVLESHNWTVRPDVIAVEDEHFSPNEPRTSAVYAYLHNKNYALVGLCGLTLVFQDAKTATQ
ncbi:FkbM family methyltransferase [Patescibacteria group bacterium]|nr:FkbM family methyltransferase [Patescibacteria group bacterium]